jgi:RES domain
MVKLPDPPPVAELHRHPPHVLELPTTQVLWRIHDCTGPHVVPWNALRFYGPLSSCRWDPHPPPTRVHSAPGVSYLATTVPTALAERFQLTRLINTHRGTPCLTAFTMNRPLRLLDLTHGWPLKIGASHAINTGPKHRTRAWARALTAAWPHLDGLWTESSMTGQPCVTVFTPAVNAFPAVAQFSEPLDHPGLATDLAAAASAIGYRLI